MTTPLLRTAEFLSTCAVAPTHEFASCARGVDALPRLAIAEGGAGASMLAMHARSIVRQLPNVSADTQVKLRDCLAKLAEALLCELEAHGGIRHPYYADPER